MRRIKITTFIALAVISAFLLALSFSPLARAAFQGLIGAAVSADDPDLPPNSVGLPDSDFSKEDFMLRRAEGIALKRGIGKDVAV